MSTKARVSVDISISYVFDTDVEEYPAIDTCKDIVEKEKHIYLTERERLYKLVKDSLLSTLKDLDNRIHYQGQFSFFPTVLVEIKKD